MDLWPKMASKRFLSLILEASENGGVIAKIMGKKVSKVSMT
jgi:hypothetical protein